MCCVCSGLEEETSQDKLFFASFRFATAATEQQEQKKSSTAAAHQKADVFNLPTFEQQEKR